MLVKADNIKQLINMLKSIKQQYIDLCEGRMSQANFMRNLRMMMPQYVTNITSFNDSIKILKNKGILTESETRIETRRNAAEELAKSLGNYDSAVVALQDKMGLSAREADLIASKIYPDDIDLYPGNMGSEMSAPTSLEEKNLDVDQEELKKGIEVEKEHTNDPVKAEEIALDHLKEDPKYYTKLNRAGLEEAKTKWEKASGKEMYGQFKEIDNLNGQEVLVGIDFELQKNTDLTKEEATKIVIKNLKKNPFYYTAEDLSGKEGYNFEYSNKSKPGSQNMVPVKGENTVDKANGMKPVKGIEKPKKDSNKASDSDKKYKVSSITLMSLIAKSSRGVQKMEATGEKMKVVKEGINEEKNYYQTNVKLSPEEIEKIKKVLPDSDFEWDGDENKQVVYSSKSEKEIRNIVDQVLGLGPVPNNTIKPGIGDAIQTKLTRENLLRMIQEELNDIIKK